MAWHLLKELVYLPVLVLMWAIDEIMWGAYRRTKVPPPVFVMSQPRSGTTFLLRTLSSDQQSFFVLKHLDWRFPFIGFWKFIDRFGLRERLEKIDYWPGTEIGRLASKMHFHNLGSVEGHGVFFEERMYHHYFTFRRFPLPEVLEQVDGVDKLSPGERKKIVRTLKRAVQKAAYYRGDGRFWLTKENENVELFRLVYEAFPDARFLVIVREPKAFVSSYIRMSDSCTTPKHGTDPNNIPGWYEANMAFRRAQCAKHIAFCRELEDKGALAYVTYDQFTGDVQGATQEIYERFGIPMGEAFAKHLHELQRKQDVRERGYSNPNAKEEGFEAYGRFVAEVAAKSDAAAQHDQPNFATAHR
ncbi:sulfotransferase [Ramlibacter sp.]|uniref:sulfotransferase n=1 Tax=Ramlibacter sp. TaxID=1917967 RepID=UPI001799DFAA|nr:sulfotransferase [Ramlibacter sp.]MBA2675081.1 sulfotransferase [Ramlibacter sp.]